MSRLTTAALTAGILALGADPASPRKHRKAPRPGPALRAHRRERRRKNKAARRARAANRRRS